MATKNKSKDKNKAHNFGQGRWNTKRPLVSSAVVPRATPITPIPALIPLAAQPELKTVSTANGEGRTVKKWCFDRTPVYYTPDEPWPSTSLNKGAVVELTGQSLSVSATGIKTSWSEIAYKIQGVQTEMQWVTGWVNDAYLDDYNEKFPASGVMIPTPTPDPTDAQQYLILEGKVRYNMCGELCVAFIVNDDINSVLAKWKKNSLNSYNAILAEGRDKPTSEADVKNMLGAILGEYGYGSDDDQLISLKNKLTYPISPTSLLEDLQRMLTTHYLISGVKISGGTGELIRKDNPLGIGHWIVLDKITRNGNRVGIYNPFPNKREEYSFTEFYNSFSTNSGIWVKRKKTSSGSHVENLPVLEVAIANPNPSYRAAQFIDVDGQKKTNLCGEFCVAFIVKESINAVLECWKEVQPVLYADFVGGNKGTGTFDLGTILRAYGYNTEGDFKDFTTGLMDPFLKKSLVSPGRIAKMLRTHFLIAGVNIDGTTGKLKPGEDVRHWVVVDKLTPIGKNRGWVELYNPFPNYWEEYSYGEFTSSAGYWSGLWVKREIVPVYVSQVVESSHAEDKSSRDYRIGQWTEAQLDAVIRQRRQSQKPINKIAAELAELSGWKKQDILSKLRLIKSGKTGAWTETRLRQEIDKRLGSGKPFNKIVAELVKASGWKKRDVIGVLKNLIESEKWTEARLRDEIKKRFKNGKHVSKISTELAELSGWKRREIINIFKQLIEAEKWTEVQLLTAIRENLKAAKPVNKIITELAEQSGWKRREILSRLKRVIETEKWSEARLRGEMDKRLQIGKSVSKISSELAGISGWRKWEISKLLKAIREPEKVGKGKVRLTIEEEPVIVVDPNTIVQASKPRAEFLEWQNSLLSQPNSKLYKVRKWGDPVMVKYAFDVYQVNTTNFQAVGLYNNGSREFGAITNFIRISHAEVMRLKAMQIEDDYVAKVDDWRSQKMNWLCKFRGTIYFFDEPSDQWRTAPYIRWGTLALGGNLVQVVDIEVIEAKMRDGIKRKVEMARLKGFRASDWNRPLDELLAEGLVHRCFCAYKDNHFGDSPKGIVYSPFYSPQDWDFAGIAKADALFIPTEWLEPKNS